MLGFIHPFWALTALVSLYVVYRTLYTYRLLTNSRTLIQASKSFVRIVPNPTHTILVLGDSTAVGTGATPASSTAGRLGNLYPHASVYNYAINGLQLAGLIKQMREPPVKDFANKKADILLLQIGANDLVYFTPLPQIERELTEVLQKAMGLGNKIIILHSGLAGTAPIFPFWIEWLWNRRAWAVRKIYMREAALYNARYVDIITSSSDANFQKDPKKYYAADMFHPSGNGYELWFEEIKKAL